MGRKVRGRLASHRFHVWKTGKGLHVVSRRNENLGR
jgi:hypothetical protein